ncbi:hypothetical protein Hanom_Chr15g01387031 [Helianthus anomalus]
MWLCVYTYICTYTLPCIISFFSATCKPNTVQFSFQSKKKDTVSFKSVHSIILYRIYSFFHIRKEKGALIHLLLHTNHIPLTSAPISSHPEIFFQQNHYQIPHKTKSFSSRKYLFHVLKF